VSPDSRPRHIGRAAFTGRVAMREFTELSIDLIDESDYIRRSF
jgi:hypothetical protein